MRARWFGFVAALLLTSTSSRAQDAARVAPAAAADHKREIGPAFVNLRYATKRAALVYVAYKVQPAYVFTGFVLNPRTDYTELILGLATTVSVPHASALVGVATATAVDARYIQYYFLPTVTFGPVEFNATVEAYQPQEAGGNRQVGAAPANLYWLAHKRASLGVTYVGDGGKGIAPDHGVGPSLRLAIPRGTIALDVIRGVTRFPNEFRTTVFTHF